jgi:hypothetical protein
MAVLAGPIGETNLAIIRFVVEHKDAECGMQDVRKNKSRCV